VNTLGLVRSYNPSGGGAPRVVANFLLEEGPDHYPGLGVWDSGTGAFLHALPRLDLREDVSCLLTYWRSGGDYRIAAGSTQGRLHVWDEEGRSLHIVKTNARHLRVGQLAVYEEPTTGRSRLVTG
jgi:hypothetical protein